MDFSYQRRLAAEILGVGENRIRFDPAALDKVEAAITREEVKKLIDEGIIYAVQERRNSRGRIREFHEERKEGRHRGYGRRKGEKGARADPKTQWMNRIRKLRAFLKWLRDHGIIDRRTYRMLYRKAKGGAFDSLVSLKRYMKEHGLLPQDYK
jgi:large subunit ribosomal protein L19e